MNHILQQPSSLLDALGQFYPESSKRTLQNWIKWGRVMINGVPQTKPHLQLQAGQVLQIGQKEQQQVLGIPIIYQDRWLVAIDKPSGLLSVPAEKEPLNALHLLKEGLKSSSLQPVHRLDQETSGVLIFARSKMAEEAFNVMFEHHDLEREYCALVEGILPHNQGTWEHYLREKEDYSVVLATPETGRKAITHYEVVHRSKKLSFLRLKLETGRKHQIRVQAATHGFPIVGDKRYGSILNPYKRLCLHAYYLSFIHPFTKKKMIFTSTLTRSGPNSSSYFPFPKIQNLPSTESDFSPDEREE